MQHKYSKHTTLIALTLASFSLVTPTVLAQGSRPEGTRYSYVQKYDDGNWQSVFYRVSGNTVTQTFSSSLYQPKTLTFTTTNGSFFAPLPVDQCISGWNTDDCGTRGVIKDDAIYLSFLINGRSLQQPGQLIIHPGFRGNTRARCQAVRSAQDPKKAQIHSEIFKSRPSENL